MAFLVVAHQVENYSTWRKAYDDNQDFRAQHNLGEARVYQDVADANQITVVAEGDLSNLQAFASDPALKDAMESAGVVGAPQIMFVNDVT